MPGFIQLILGGARSGKSRRAEELARMRGENIIYVATCATTVGALDDEMRERILRHKERRPATWRTIENRFDLPAIVEENAATPVLLDCLTLWLAFRQSGNESEVLHELERALQIIRKREATWIIVSNELGMGIVPLGAENRKFRDLCGHANQLVASHADAVEMMIAGLPMKLK
jgi:adenosylcobinamide kinase/adenosylcobinamide-phosphate guanylyltransferase